MTFGEWIRQLRKEQKLDILTLAERSGVEGSTISRVENDRTQVTLLIAIRLCDGLHMTISDVLTQVYSERKMKKTQEEVIQIHTVPTMDDVEQFLRYFHDHHDETKAWLSDLLNMVSFLDENPEKNIHPYIPRIFTPEDIQKLLFESQLYRFEIHYPPTITASSILTLYKQGAMLTLTDIAEFTRKLRREKQVTLAKLEQSAKISQNVLSRLESPFIEQIKLADVIMLDTHLEQEGTLLEMYWSVYSFYQRCVRSSASTADQEMKIYSIYIVICRWLQTVNAQDDVWLKHMRTADMPTHIAPPINIV